MAKVTAQTAEHLARPFCLSEPLSVLLPVPRLHLLFVIQQRAPDAAITGDVIVGFPGETEDQFQHTLDLMERVKFDNLNTFRCVQLYPRISFVVVFFPRSIGWREGF